MHEWPLFPSQPGNRTQPEGRISAMDREQAGTAAVVIHYRSPETVVHTVHDLRAVLSRVIVVDNSGELAEDYFEGAELLAGQGNVGYGRAANLGISAAFRSDRDIQRVLVTTHETRYGASVVASLVSASSSLPPAHVLAPVLMTRGTDGGLRVWSAGGTMSALQYPKHRRRVGPGLRKALWVDGASFIIDRDAWELTGGVPEDFFLYMEDVALGFRCHSLGVPVYVTSETTVEQSATGPGRALAVRNRLILAQRYLPLGRRLIVLGEFFTRTAALRAIDARRYAENVAAWREAKAAMAVGLKSETS